MKPPLRRTAVTLLTIAAWMTSATVLAEEDLKKTVYFKAFETMESVEAKGRERTLLTGSVEIIVDDTLIRAEHIELLGKGRQIIVCRGAVQVIDDLENIEINSEHLLFDRDRSLLSIQGSVLLIDRANEIMMKGGFLEYNQDSGEMTVQIGVRILNTDLVSRSEFARYRRDENTINLSGMPMVTWRDNEYRSMRIFIDLDEESIRMEGQIQGTIRLS